MTAGANTEDAETVLLLGGRSEIGLEIAVRLAPGGRIVLAARRSNDLEQQRTMLTDAGALAVTAVEFDADATDTHADFLAQVARAHGRIDVAVLAFGILGDQARAETDAAHAVAIVHTDYVAQVSILTLLADLMKRQGRGKIAVFSSVAGVRVRRANYVYGSAKAGLDGFASGLGDALHGSGIQLLLVRPGFVIGSMTEGMKPAPMSSTPAQVADAVVRGLQSGATRVWVPRILQPVFFMMRLLPQSIWRRMPR
ncbi:SDR family NAD(P)-dependent oxidoreductase [Rhodococcus sp. IEGM 1366]|uniref:SDR family NAD(P)-dependent oxidoreductase n=1 Tax=Rhodococcus sp. IEGM 1366 TaxID=3082223 RepID=UPI0029536181|nr:SDR family NAD(P)-dependent oxidoreductase [Rhodococcus sp. IEGM 1366]MDV8068068.1 SDR family NAD(P)-dependent oxidoreductase [Rhodococcus sp. IEGM 1366]